MMIRPHVQREIDATTDALRQLRGSVERAAERWQKPVVVWRSAAQKAAADIRRLDAAYTRHIGGVLKHDKAPPYTGHMYEWPPSTTRESVRKSVVGTLYRVRKLQWVGIHPTTHFQALNYFSAIWPDDLDWPADIRRPPKSKEEA